MLTVIAIIAILAALLLPVLNKSQMRAKSIMCGNSLEQIGLAYHGFSNDHSGKFPMAVSTNDGGSLEYVQSGLSIGPGQYFYTSFRNFQVLSGELVRPELLFCPADLVRAAATNFPSLQNSNLSYFVGVGAAFDKPESVLAGDRNLGISDESQPAGTIIKIGPQYSFYWTYELHNNQGNFLFSDGHVVEGSSGVTSHEVSGTGDNQILFMPSVVPVNYTASFNGGGGNGGGGSGGGGSGQGGNAGSGSTGQPGGPSGNSGPSSEAQSSASSWNSGSSPAAQSGTPPASQPAQPQEMSSSENKKLYAMRTDSEPGPTTGNAPTTPAASSDVNDATVLPGADTESGTSQFNRHYLKPLQHTFEMIYLLFLLLMLLYLAKKIRDWAQRREARQRGKRMSQKTPGDSEDSFN
jgi:prepilin-type processing-associated H-X9-DG protein